MFRRKEEGLFDSTIDSTQESEDSTSNTATSGSQSSTGASAQTASASGASSAPAYGAPPTPPSQATRTAAPSANSFRPSAAPIASDLSRGRMPEAKQSAGAAASSPATSAVTPPSASKSVRRVLTVGSDILLKGEIATCDRLVIEGKVDAILNDVHTVEIAESGSFKGSAHIEDAEISGLFEGDLIVRNRLVIYATGKVRGQITYGEIEIERGGELTGEIKITNAQQQAPSARSARQTKDDKVAA